MSNPHKKQFLDEFGDYYGYPNGPKSIDEIRATEFKRLNEGVVYLDHAGATLYSELQMEAIFKDFSTTVYGNPHSQSDSSSATSDIIREARQQVLEYCNASLTDYSCIFTSGATAALKLIGETFPWSCDSTFMYTMENHNSVLGIREYALSQGASAVAIDATESVNDYGEIFSAGSSVKVIPHKIQRRSNSGVPKVKSTGNAYSLLAFPSECNFTGLRFSLDLVNKMKEEANTVLEGSSLSKKQCMVLVDAAKGCLTQPPDLSKYPADFVVMSFYKLFGYPTGFGALVLRNDAAKLLKKTYFSGGTVAASIADIDFVKRREGVEELFEDGTTSFLSIASIRHGFKILNSLTASGIRRHTTSLSMYMKKTLLNLRHENGIGACVVYGSQSLEFPSDESGPIVSFNLKRPDGSWYGYREVEKLASLSGIQLRTGCFCNPGACAKYLGLSHSDLLSNIEAGHVCWDDNDIINGKPSGAVRVSFGYMSTYEDAKKFIDFVRSSFVSLPNNSELGYIPISSPSALVLGHSIFLKSITVYPIKSCGGFSVESWPLSITGLQHDREWHVRSLSGEVLTQKKVPEMSFISTSIDLKRRILYVESPCCKAKLQIKIDSDSYHAGQEKTDMHSKRFDVYNDDKEVNQWFTNAVGRPCTLVRSSSSHKFSKSESAGMCRNVESRLNFVNEAQFLLISEESISDLNTRLISADVRIRGAPVQINASRFRPNIVVSGSEPYAEDGWRNLKIGNTYFTCLGGCNRCHMVNINQVAGRIQKSNEPLATLASYRRVKGKILFGILLRCERDADSWLHVGQQVFPDSD